MIACHYDILWCYQWWWVCHCDDMSFVSPEQCRSYVQYANDHQTHNKSHDIRHMFLPHSETPMLFWRDHNAYIYIYTYIYIHTHTYINNKSDNDKVYIDFCYKMCLLMNLVFGAINKPSSELRIARSIYHAYQCHGYTSHQVVCKNDWLISSHAFERM